MTDFVVATPARLVAFLRQALPDWKRSTIEQRMRAGTIFVNEVAVERNDLLAEGDRVRVGKLGEVSARRPPPSGITVLYEDQDLVAIDKPGGMLAVAAGDERDVTAMALMREHLTRPGAPVRLWPAHRIDRETSGVLLFTKSREAQRVVQQGWGEARKVYVALVEGVPDPAAGTIDQKLWEDKALFVRIGPYPEAKEAITHYRTLEARGARALLEVELETGRRHQIRAHLAWLGHPVVGDARYGTAGPRMGLHARSLTLAQPHEGRTLTIEAPIPTWIGAPRRRADPTR
ncbi:MAG: RluA family pseudouridine synthase [Planctomycetota bacterium]